MSQEKVMNEAEFHNSYHRWVHENLFRVTKILKYWIVVMITQLYKVTKSHLTVQFKLVNFMVCELYLNKDV